MLFLSIVCFSSFLCIIKHVKDSSISSLEKNLKDNWPDSGKKMVRKFYV